MREPFASINADDYYGKRAFRAVAEHLLRPAVAQAVPEYCVVGYPVLGTLSEHGAVARAICDIDEEGYLRGLVERTRLERHGATGRYVDEGGNVCMLRGNEVVSMNMLGFSPPVFAQLEGHLARFLEAEARHAGRARVPDPRRGGPRSCKRRPRGCASSKPSMPGSASPTKATSPWRWRALRKMVERGEYPSPIWKDA